MCFWMTPKTWFFKPLSGKFSTTNVPISVVGSLQYHHQHSRYEKQFPKKIPAYRLQQRGKKRSKEVNSPSPKVSKIFNQNVQKKHHFSTWLFKKIVLGNFLKNYVFKFFFHSALSLPRKIRIKLLLAFLAITT